MKGIWIGLIILLFNLQSIQSQTKVKPFIDIQEGTKWIYASYFKGKIASTTTIKVVSVEQSGDSMIANLTYTFGQTLGKKTFESPSRNITYKWDTGGELSMGLGAYVPRIMSNHRQDPLKIPARLNVGDELENSGIYKNIDKDIYALLESENVKKAYNSLSLIMKDRKVTSKKVIKTKLGEYEAYQVSFLMYKKTTFSTKASIGTQTSIDKYIENFYYVEGIGLIQLGDRKFDKKGRLHLFTELIEYSSPN